jgi:hypothetical protein
MRISIVIFLSVVGAVVFPAASAQVANTSPEPPTVNEAVPPPPNNYPLSDESLGHASVPAGKSFQFTMSDSKIFPNTTRTITVYTPASYTGQKPACVYLALDTLTKIRNARSTTSLPNMQCRLSSALAFLQALSHRHGLPKILGLIEALNSTP